MLPANRGLWQPDLTKYERAEPSEAKSPLLQPPPPVLPTPGFSQFLRCPIPIISSTSDGLRQFYRDVGVPQYRLVPPGVF